MPRRRIIVATLLSSLVALPLHAVEQPPNAGRGAGTVPTWNPHRPAPGNPPLTVRVLVLNYDPIVPAEGHRRLSQVFGWNEPARLATECKEAMEYATGGYLRFEIVEWRNLDEIYAKEDGYRYTVEEYVRNRRSNSGWGEHGNADYPRLLREQNVVPLIDDGLVDEVWIFSDHFFGLWEASMAGPGAFFINGGVYPQVPSARPFAIYGFNYERGVAEMMHNAAHRTEATLNRALGSWDLKDPKSAWDKFSANAAESGGRAGVGTCHFPANGAEGYDYGNPRVVQSWADAYLSYPKLNFATKPVSRDTWSRGPDYHLDYMKWYFAHIPRAEGADPDGRQNNWLKYIFDFPSYDARGRAVPATAALLSRDVADPETNTHTLRVAYRSAEQVDPKSLGSDDLAVTGPDGKPLAVRLVAGNEPGNRPYRVTRYEVTAPAANWQAAGGGPYEVALRDGAVRDLTGTPVPAGRLGRFRVVGSGPAPAPKANSGALLVRAPATPLLPGALGVAQAVSRAEVGAEKNLTRDVAWSSDAPAVATIDPHGTIRALKEGRATITARSGKTTASARIEVRDPGLPKARLVQAKGVTRPGAEPVAIVIAYTDPDGIVPDSIGLGDVRVVGPNGFHEFPERTSIDRAGRRGLRATYRVKPPVGRWRPADRGVYTVELKGFQVADGKGNHVPEQVIGQFRVLGEGAR
jgi:hypothetical protein